MCSFLRKICHVALLDVITVTPLRFISASSKLEGKSRTYESKPVPGSTDDVDPLAWAQRLFDLNEIRKNYTYSNDSSPVFMICRLKPIKGTTFFERAFLEKFGIGPDTKVILSWLLWCFRCISGN